MKSEKLSLTKNQIKAWKSFERAYKKCKDANIKFYTVIQTIFPLNGDHLVRVHDEENKGDFCLQHIYSVVPYSISDSGFDSWADDDHFAEID